MSVDLNPDTSETRYALQMAARHEMILKLLADINADMIVCKLERWPVDEYPRMIVKAVTFEGISYD